MEAECANAYTCAGFLATDDPPSVDALCQALMLTRPRFADVSRVTVQFRRGKWAMLVPEHLSDEDARFAAALVVAEHWLKLRGIDAANASQLAGALLCPRPAFLRCVELVGRDAETLADLFGCPVEVALLRIGEVTGQPVVLSDRTSNVVHMRGRRERGTRPLRMEAAAP